jgi:hypothetical protein
MAAHKKPDLDDKSQAERFIEMARELGCDEDEAAFKETLSHIARHKPKSVPPEPPEET